MGRIKAGFTIYIDGYKVTFPRGTIPQIGVCELMNSNENKTPKKRIFYLFTCIYQRTVSMRMCR